MFRITFGYSLSFGETDGTPLITLVSYTPLVVVAVWMFVIRRPFNPDRIFEIALLIVVAGLIIVPSADALPFGTVNSVLTAGVTLADLVMWFVLAALASRNRLGAVTTVAWGSSMSIIGVILGAGFGRLSNNLFLTGPSYIPLVTATIVIAFLTYVIMLSKNFSFKSTIGAIQPDKEVIVPTTITTNEFEEHCSRLATHYQLTPREAEVLLLLARGRNIGFITEELVVSRNTVKAHVKHIYQKLDIHTQQQLIDLVEAP